MIEVVYAEEFIKDLKKLKGSPYYTAIKSLCFDYVPSLKSPTEIVNLKKLKGFDDFFRIRKGDYRIGVRIEKNSIQFLRCMSRKDIYKYFPKK